MHIQLPSKVASPTSKQVPRSRLAPKLRNTELMQFTQQIATLLLAGLTVLDAIRIFRGGQQRPAALKLLTKLEYDLDNGLALSQAIGAFPDSFDPLYWRLVSAGESSGP